MSDLSDHIAVVLPARETFSVTGSGSVSLLVHRLTSAPSRHRRVVIGLNCTNPFSDVPFQGAELYWMPGRRGWRYAVGVSRVLRRPKLIEVHNRADVALVIARMHSTTPVALFLHNDPQTMRGLKSVAQRRAASRSLAGIVCVSQFLAERLKDGAPEIATSVLPNCMDLSVLPTPPSERDRVILFVGRLVSDKGADSFVEACRQVLPELPGWRAEMVGADRFAANSPITTFVAKLIPSAAKAHVTLAGYQTFPQVMASMARAAIIVVPSRWQEPFGLVALEAMANGAAVVCSGRGGLTEVVQGVALPCDPDDPTTIAAAIRHLARHPDERAARGAAGWARAGLFDLRVTAARLDALRDDLLMARPNLSPSIPADIRA